MLILAPVDILLIDSQGFAPISKDGTKIMRQKIYRVI